jgi:hypothetical protein
MDSTSQQTQGQKARTPYYPIRPSINQKHTNRRSSPTTLINSYFLSLSPSPPKKKEKEIKKKKREKNLEWIPYRPPAETTEQADTGPQSVNLAPHLL